MLFTHTGPAPTPDRLTGVRLADGTVVARQARTVAPRFVARSGVLTTLGRDPSPHPLGRGSTLTGDRVTIHDAVLHAVRRS